ncbi:MAG: hypothetical protein AAB468_00365 [Patescibacteria group bacterium]
MAEEYTTEQVDFLKTQVPALSNKLVDRERASQIANELNEKFGCGHSVGSVIQKHRVVLNGSVRHTAIATKKAATETKHEPHRYTAEQNDYLAELAGKKNLSWLARARLFNHMFGCKVKMNTLQVRWSSLRRKTCVTKKRIAPSLTVPSLSPKVVYAIQVNGKTVWEGSTNPTKTIRVVTTSVIATL